MELEFDKLAEQGNIMLQVSARDLTEFANKLLSERENMMEERVRLLKEEHYYSTKEVEKKFGVSKPTIYKWQREGFIKARKLGGKNVWLHSEIEKMMFVKY
jgi:excisionase family DNA binding protein